MQRGAREAGAAIDDYANSIYFDAEERTAANKLLRENDTLSYQKDLQDVTRGLEKTGNLPQLLLHEMDPKSNSGLDEDADGDLSRSEIKRVLDEPQNFEPTTVLAARTADKHYDEILEADGGLEWTNRYLTRDEMKAWNKNADAKSHPRGEDVFDSGDVDRPTRRNRRDDDDYADDDRSRKERHQKERRHQGQSDREVLEDSRSTMKDKLESVQSLAERGHRRIVLDKDGERIECRIEVSKVSPNSDEQYVHLYAEDESGKEHILLRAINDDGKLRKQVDEHGREVDYLGDWWSRNGGRQIIHQRSRR